MFYENMNYERIVASGKTVFTMQDLLLIFDTNYPQTVRNFLQRMKKKGIMYKVQNGVWVTQKYNMYELANKLKKNSYISCETVLKEAGAIFQYYGNTVTSVSDNTLTKHIQGTVFVYRNIKDSLISNPEGIIYHDNAMIATPERALCDMLYLSPKRYCDDLSMIDRDMVKDLAQFYNKRLILRINELAHDRQGNS